MLIACPHCEKNFNVDASLIPDQGRLLQCGLCSHKWFFKNENISNIHLSSKSTAPIKISPTADIPKDTESIIKQAEEKIKDSTNKIINQHNNPNDINLKNNIDKNIIGSVFSYIVVGIISFIALIILLDTFKTPLIELFPKLDYFLVSLYEILKDIELFIIDLTL